MNCPVCREIMIIAELDAVEVDCCPRCRGIWLDAGELEILLEGSADRDAVLKAFAAAAPSGEPERPCPVCRRRMAKAVCGPAGGEVVIDRCRRNDGLWFDAGELNTVLRLGQWEQDSRVLALLNGMFGTPQ